MKVIDRIRAKRLKQNHLSDSNTLSPDFSSNSPEMEETAPVCPHGIVWQYCRECAKSDLAKLNAAIKQQRADAEAYHKRKKPLDELWPDYRPPQSYEELRKANKKIFGKYADTEAKITAGFNDHRAKQLRKGSKVVMLRNEAIDELIDAVRGVSKVRAAVIESWRTWIEVGAHVLIARESDVYIWPFASLESL